MASSFPGSSVHPRVEQRQHLVRRLAGRADNNDIAEARLRIRDSAPRGGALASAPADAIPDCSAADHAAAPDARPGRRSWDAPRTPQPRSRRPSDAQIPSARCRIASRFGNGLAAVIAAAHRVDPQQRMNAAFGERRIEMVELVERHPILPNTWETRHAPVGNDVQAHMRDAGHRRQSRLEGVQPVRSVSARSRQQWSPAARRVQRTHRDRGRRRVAFEVTRVHTRTWRARPTAEADYRPVGPAVRRRLVSQPSAMPRGGPGMIRLWRDPKNMSLLSTTLPP